MSIIIGQNTQTGQPISVTQEYLQAGTYLLGVQQVEKASVLINLIL